MFRISSLFRPKSQPVLDHRPVRPTSSIAPDSFKSGGLAGQARHVFGRVTGNVFGPVCAKIQTYQAHKKYLKERGELIRRDMQVNHPLAHKVVVSGLKSKEVSIDVEIFNDKGKIFATGCAHEGSPGHLYIHEITVHQDVRGSGAISEKGAGMGTAIICGFMKVAQKHFKTVGLWAQDDGKRAWTHERYHLKFGSVDYEGAVTSFGTNPVLPGEFTFAATTPDVALKMQDKFNQWMASREGQFFLRSSVGRDYIENLTARGVTPNAIGNNPSLYPQVFKNLFEGFDLVRDLNVYPITDEEIAALEAHVQLKFSNRKS